jgi:beta-glucosidase-like glycosyl hydrolase
MAACGLNVILGPVADVNTEPRNPVIGTRSFGDDPASVAVLVRESVKVCREAGLAACIKHFPGHGSTTEDSHFSLPPIRRASHELKRIDRPPFGAGIWAGAELVMTGHVVPPDCNGPATLEPGIIVGILREELCYDGVVITDALEMAGVRWIRASTGEGTGSRQMDEIVDLAIRAGNDLLLFSRPVDDVYGELERIGELRMDPRSIQRIEKLRIALPDGRGGAPGFSGGVRSGYSYREVASRSIEVKRDPGSLLPVRDADPASIVFVGERADFENGIVREFSDRILLAFDREAGEQGRVDDLFSGRIGLPGGFERAEFRPHGADGPILLLLLNRRPIDLELLVEITSQAGIVVVTDWPPAAGMLSDRLTVISTFGVYEAAVEGLLDAQ